MAFDARRVKIFALFEFDTGIHLLMRKRQDYDRFVITASRQLFIRPVLIRSFYTSNASHTASQHAASHDASPQQQSGGAMQPVGGDESSCSAQQIEISSTQTISAMGRMTRLMSSRTKTENDESQFLFFSRGHSIQSRWLR